MLPKVLSIYTRLNVELTLAWASEVAGEKKDVDNAAGPTPRPIPTPTRALDADHGDQHTAGTSTENALPMKQAKPAKEMTRRDNMLCK